MCIYEQIKLVKKSSKQGLVSYRCIVDSIINDSSETLRDAPEIVLSTS